MPINSKLLPHIFFKVENWGFSSVFMYARSFCCLLRWRGIFAQLTIKQLTPVNIGARMDGVLRGAFFAARGKFFSLPIPLSGLIFEFSGREMDLHVSWLVIHSFLDAIKKFLFQVFVSPKNGGRRSKLLKLLQIIPFC